MLGFVFNFVPVRIEINSLWECLSEPGLLHRVILLNSREVVTWTVNADGQDHGRSWLGSPRDFVHQFNRVVLK